MDLLETFLFCREHGMLLSIIIEGAAKPETIDPRNWDVCCQGQEMMLFSTIIIIITGGGKFRSGRIPFKHINDMSVIIDDHVEELSDAG